MIKSYGLTIEERMKRSFGRTQAEARAYNIRAKMNSVFNRFAPEEMPWDEDWE